jgi:hypothetical protein
MRSQEALVYLVAIAVSTECIQRRWFSQIRLAVVLVVVLDRHVRIAA